MKFLVSPKVGKKNPVCCGIQSGKCGIQSGKNFTVCGRQTGKTSARCGIQSGRF